MLILRTTLLFAILIECLRCGNLRCKTFMNKVANQSQIVEITGNEPRTNVIVRSILRRFGGTLLYGRAMLLDTSHLSLEVLQANNDNEGCKNHHRALPSHTGEIAGSCEVVLNAGLFDTRTGECYGNLVNRGRLLINSKGIRNAHFGIKKDGSLLFGYLSEEEVLSDQFESLVGGAVWLLRNGISVVNESVKEECGEVQETGSLWQFANVVSARSAIGALRNGTVMIVQVGGRTGIGGLNLFHLADLMADMGVVAAINLDGGGSSTAVVNNTLVSNPSDKCGPFTCEREVTTVLCARARHSPHSPQPLGYLSYVSVALAACVCLALLVVCFLLLALRLRHRTPLPIYGDTDGSLKLPLMDEEL